MANSSMLVFPVTTTPASSRRCTAVPVKGGTKFSRMREPHVQRTPFKVSTSFKRHRQAQQPGQRLGWRSLALPGLAAPVCGLGHLQGQLGCGRNVGVHIRLKALAALQESQGQLPAGAIAALQRFQALAHA